MNTVLTEIFWTQQSSLPLLLLVQLLPLFGAALVFALRQRSTAVLAGKCLALAELLLLIYVVGRIDPTLPALQLAERAIRIENDGYLFASDQPHAYANEGERALRFFRCTSW